MPEGRRPNPNNPNTPAGGWDGPLGIELKQRRKAIEALATCIDNRSPHSTGTMAAATKIKDQTPREQRGKQGGVFLFEFRVTNKTHYALFVHEGAKIPSLRILDNPHISAATARRRSRQANWESGGAAQIVYAGTTKKNVQAAKYRGERTTYAKAMQTPFGFIKSRKGFTIKANQFILKGAEDWYPQVGVKWQGTAD